MSQFLIGASAGNEETATVANGGPADKAAAGDSGVDDGDVGGEFGFKYGVEVF